MNKTNHKTASLRIPELRFAYSGSDWSLHVSSFSLEAGELVSITGPNGSGKSTFLKLMAGLLQGQEGEPFLNDVPLSKMKRRDIAKYIGYLPQLVPSGFNYRVAELVAMGRYPYITGSGFLTKQDEAVIQNCMEITDTKELAQRRIFQLSGGERQRVFLASVLAQEPSILLFDEPTNSLDLNHQVQFLHILLDLSERGIAVVLVTHDINLASSVSDRILLLQNGKIVQEGKAEEVFTPDVITDIYGDDFIFMQHPNVNRPLIFPAYNFKQSKG